MLLKDTTTAFIALLIMIVGVLTTTNDTKSSVETRKIVHNEYTHKVSIHNQYGHLCDAIVIDCEHLITSAQCVHSYQPYELSVWIRRIPSLYRCGIAKEIKEILIPQQYHDHENGIAIIQMKENFTESDFVKPISIKKFMFKNNLQQSTIRWQLNFDKQSLIIPVSIIFGINEEICKSSKDSATSEIITMDCVEKRNIPSQNMDIKNQLDLSNEFYGLNVMNSPSLNLFKKMSYYLPWIENRTDQLFAFYESVKNMQIAAMIIAMTLYITLFK